MNPARLLAAGILAFVVLAPALFAAGTGASGVSPPSPTHRAGWCRSPSRPAR